MAKRYDERDEDGQSWPVDLSSARERPGLRELVEKWRDGARLVMADTRRNYSPDDPSFDMGETSALSLERCADELASLLASAPSVERPQENAHAGEDCYEMAKVGSTAQGETLSTTEDVIEIDEDGKVHYPPVRDPHADLKAASAAAQGETCEWKEDEDGNWHTACDGMFETTSGTPISNCLSFCCYCGRSLREVPLNG